MKPLELPPLTKIRHRFETTRVEDVEASLRKQFEKTRVPIPTSREVAIAVGSRGITDLQAIVRQTVQWVQAKGATPFIVPAMGSHGGATAEGQQKVLASLGISETTIGAEIRSSMEVVELAKGQHHDLSTELYFDKHAAEAAGTILINRIKVHTDFHGPYESGLMKMLVIGLGKQKQAGIVHGFGTSGLRELVPRIGRKLLEHANVIMGIGIVENAYDQTLHLRVVPAAEIPDQEPELLEMSRQHMPSLPIDQIDILIVDQIGKNISGVGMDTNIIGRMMIAGEPEPDRPRIRLIIARDLCAESHGNALGMGLADICTKRLFEKIDFAALNENVYTATFLERAKIPVVADTDEQALAFALRVCNQIHLSELKIVRIRNTLHLDELLVSDAVLKELDGRDSVEVVGPVGAPLDSNGQLRPL